MAEEKMSARRDAAQAGTEPSVIWAEYQQGLDFNNAFSVYDTVENNENFYIGKQWEGVQSNGLPTPVFNMIKRIVNFQVATTSTDNLKINAAPLPTAGVMTLKETERVCNILNAQLQAVMETNSAGRTFRSFMRDTAVRGDGCMYAWYDPEMETGQKEKGGIRLELLENTRVLFGNPTSRDVQSQPWIIVEMRKRVEDVRAMAAEFGGDVNLITPDGDSTGDRFDAHTDDKVTTLYRFSRDRESGTIRASITTRDCVVRGEWDTEQKLYPLVWMSWDHVTGYYHGMGLVTGLIPNQIFVNKMFAMVYLSLMTTAYPKVVYDGTRIARWDAAVGTAIKVNGGDMNNVARTVAPAAISPQVSQFIQMTVDMTKDLMGATDAAMGSTRPDNTSAIIALQKAASVPVELVKQNFFQCVEDLARVWIDLMRVYYGVRTVGLRQETAPQGAQTPLVPGEDGAVEVPEVFDFSTLQDNPIYIKLDVGGSSYWSEIAQLQTLDNLLKAGKISTREYVRRLPAGYLSMQKELEDKLGQEEEMQRQAILSQGAGQNAAPGAAGSAPNASGAPGGSAALGGLLQKAMQG